MHGERRLRRGLAQIPWDGGLILAGARRRLVFRGAAAADVLPRLLARLDGSTDVDTVRGEPDLTAAQFAHVMTMLEDRGLLEPAPSPASAAAVSDDVACFLSRAWPNAPHRGTGEIVDALAKSVVHIAGDGGVAAMLAADLRASGVTVRWTPRGRPADAEARGLTEAGCGLVVVIDDPGDPRHLDGVVEWCRPQRIPALRIAGGANRIEVGPCFWARSTACPECLHRGRREASWNLHGAADAAAAAVLAGLAGARILAILTGISTATTPFQISRTDLGDRTTRRCLAVPYRDCHDCGGGAAAATDRESDLVAAYEWSVQGWPPPLEAAGNAARSGFDIEALMAQRPRLASHPRRPLADDLPPVDGYFGTPTAAPAPLDESTLAAILRRVGGLRRERSDGRRQRWVPNGGNLASVELYLIAPQGFSGLPGSVFRYADLTHELIAVSPDGVGLPEALSGTDLAIPPTGVALITTAAGERLAAKYGPFARRLAHLDAGCAATQLAAVADGYGLSVAFASRWDGHLAEVLGLAHRDQFITAVATIRTPAIDGGS